jgi:phosphonate transport system substrate-binding protein
MKISRWRRTLFAALWFFSGAAGAAPLVIGSVSHEPADEIRKFQPLADYLARHLAEFGVEQGNVVVASGMKEMAQRLRSGQVDIYIDSAFPSIVVSRLADSRIVLRRWKKGREEYRSVVFVRSDSPIRTVSDLPGKVIAFEEPYSTSGYFLPKSVLQQAGLKLSEQVDAGAPVKAGEVGYVFAMDDDNIPVWVLRGKVAAAAMDDASFAKLPPQRRDNLRVMHRTAAVPRHLVSVRKGLDPRLASGIKAVLLAMEHSEEGRQALQKFEMTTRFDELPGGPEKALAPLLVLTQEIEREMGR